jgi:hypothetical protein
MKDAACQPLNKTAHLELVSPQEKQVDRLEGYGRRPPPNPSASPLASPHRATGHRHSPRGSQGWRRRASPPPPPIGSGTVEIWCRARRCASCRHSSLRREGRSAVCVVALGLSVSRSARRQRWLRQWGACLLLRVAAPMVGEVACYELVGWFILGRCLARHVR